jgi:GT2 family glycosyltransferase
MRVDVIVCTYNRAAMLEETLAGLRGQDIGAACAFDVLVVDNDSTDGTTSVVESAARSGGAPVRYVFEAAHGVANARNRGVREATADWLAFIDDDEVPETGWLRELASVASEKRAACVSGSVGLALPAGSALPPFCRGLLGATPEPDAPVQLTGKQLPGTGNVLVHRSVFDRVGAFDVGLAHGGEDEDFFQRVRRAGFAIWYAPRARIVHRIPPYRLTPAYLTWTASRHGVHYALRDSKKGGRARVLGQALLRGGQVIATVASLLAARAAGDDAALLDHRCRLARAVAYERQALRLLAPWITQARFFEQLEFRGERARFGT